MLDDYIRKPDYEKPSPWWRGIFWGFFAAWLGVTVFLGWQDSSKDFAVKPQWGRKSHYSFEYSVNHPQNPPLLCDKQGRLIVQCKHGGAVYPGTAEWSSSTSMTRMIGGKESK